MEEGQVDVVEDAIETKAREGGWRPKDEFEGNAADWVDAKEFNKRGELFGKIKDLKNEMASRDARHVQELRIVANSIKEMRKQALEQARMELQDKLEASDDKAATVKLAKDIDKVETEIRQLDTVQRSDVPPTSPEVQNWLTKNDSWYNKDKELTLSANAAAAVYINQNPTASHADALEHVDKEMKKMYPDKFGPKKVVTPASPEGGNKEGSPTNNSKGAGKYKESDLPENAAKVMNVLIKRGITTKEDYLKSYFEKA